MSEEQKNDQGTPEAPQAPATPQAPETAPIPEQATAPQQPPLGGAVPPQQPPVAQPQPQPQPMYAPQPQPCYPPAPLMQLTGGMKFAWLVVGALLGIPGIIIAWLVNADKMPQVKSDALKFAIIGFVIWIVLQFIFGMVLFGTISAAMYGLMGSFDASSYGYGYHGSW